MKELTYSEKIYTKLINNDVVVYICFKVNLNASCCNIKAILLDPLSVILANFIYIYMNMVMRGLMEKNRAELEQQ